MGARLDLGNLYGIFSGTYFDGAIDDFSGNQVLITLGINVGLNIAAKSSRDKWKILDKDLTYNLTFFCLEFHFCPMTLYLLYEWDYYYKSRIFETAP